MIYLVKRIGSNAANQAGQQVKTICFVEADSQAEARERASVIETVYNNQRLEIFTKEDLTPDEWNKAIDDGVPFHKKVTEYRMPE
jgi:hypothetical protein